MVRVVPPPVRLFARKAAAICPWAITIGLTLIVWQKRAQDRTHLANLDGYLLKDMGLNPSEVEVERAKPFWRA